LRSKKKTNVKEAIIINPIVELEEALSYIIPTIESFFHALRMKGKIGSMAMQVNLEKSL